MEKNCAKTCGLCGMHRLRDIKQTNQRMQKHLKALSLKAFHRHRIYMAILNRSNIRLLLFLEIIS